MGLLVVLVALVALVALAALAGGCRRRSVKMVQLISNTGSQQQAASSRFHHGLAGISHQASVIRHRSSGISHRTRGAAGPWL
jgi:hypothetical protein